MARKTFLVEDLVDYVNERNAKSVCDPAIREGWNSLLTYILMETDNYKGFGYLTPSQVPEGEAPGIQEYRGLFPKRLGADQGVFQNCDETRRFYYKR